jgi:pimeloyl-ACP methyl ester carboxylesterase
MNYSINGHSTYCYTGGKTFDAAKPSIIFIHGALNDHSVWILQSRYLANHGFNVLALDLPGHCRSAGAPPATVEEAADFVLALMDAAGLKQAILMGHSYGSLIALEAAGRAPERISQLVLVGTAFPMKVSPALLQATQDEPLKALKLVNDLSWSTLAPPPSALGAGTWVHGASMALGRRVIASNTQANVFYCDFKACDSYSHGEEAMQAVTCPVLFVLGQVDQMTPPKAAQGLIDKARQATVVKLPGGHHQMNETAEPMLAALKHFLKT